MTPLYQEIPYQDPAGIFQLFAEDPYAIFLDSAQHSSAIGRYSFIATDPFSMFTYKGDTAYVDERIIKENPFAVLRSLLANYKITAVPDMPPLQGGVLGYWGYDLCQQLESSLVPNADDMQFPDLILGFYDVVFAFDHVLRKAWIFSTGFPEIESKREMRAQQRLHFFLARLKHVEETKIVSTIFCSKAAIRPNFSQATYKQAVNKVIDYIYAGDIFQANLTQRFMVELDNDFSPWQLYQKLRQKNPAPFAAYFNAGETIIASASPERFLRLYDQQVETRPIKGTSKRAADPIEDARKATELQNSAKDRAENIMIVDLLRNDLSKVCSDHGVKVPQLCGLESYATVHHLVSVVEGKLNPSNNAVDLLRAAFPGGSITGAPKVRAMQIIYELELNQRGPYCGSMGYIGFDGCMDTSIIIRTYCIKNNVITFQAGGAIVADSDPEQEYQESLVKAQALFDVLTEHAT